MKLPEPVIAREECAVSSGEYYTADQMHQYRIDALEEAAEICEKKNPHPDQWSDQREYTVANTVIDCAIAIRELKEKKHE